MSFNNNMIIDATRGTIARFVNHSCEPNCEMIKWTPICRFVQLTTYHVSRQIHKWPLKREKKQVGGQRPKDNFPRAEPSPAARAPRSNNPRHRNQEFSVTGDPARLNATAGTISDPITDIPGLASEILTTTFAAFDKYSTALRAQL
jgi:hypothetical protein